jgi:hypothetical protein
MPPSKESIRSKIEELIQGMILLKVEDESAWATTLEWMDVTSLGQSFGCWKYVQAGLLTQTSVIMIDGYSLSFLHEYSLLFPSSPYTTLITGYLRYFDLPGPNDEVTEKIRAKKRERRKAKKDGGKKGKKDVAPEAESKEDDVSAEDALKTEENKRKEPYTVLIVSRFGTNRCRPSLICALLTERDRKPAQVSLWPQDPIGGVSSRGRLCQCHRYCRKGQELDQGIGYRDGSQVSWVSWSRQPKCLSQCSTPAPR